MEDRGSFPALPGAVYFAVIILLACQQELHPDGKSKAFPALMALMKGVFGRPRLDSGLA